MASDDANGRHHAASDRSVATPTTATVFLRTFLPWQLWRFVQINLKMLAIVRRRGQHLLPPADRPPRP